jgi:pseudouridine kinase
MPRVVCIGGANWDIKARANVPFVAGASNPGAVSRTPGGVARNIAENLARLGIETTLITAAGEDSEGDDLIEATSAAGVQVLAHRSETRKTGAYISIHDATGEMRAAINAMEIIDELAPASPFMGEVARSAGGGSELRFILADCNLPLETLAWLKTLGHRLVIEPVSVAKSRKLVDIGLDGIFLVTPNQAQAEVLKAAKGRAEHMVVTLGGEGALADGILILPLADPSRIVDVTGAGDAATAGLVYGLLQNLSLAEAAHFGQAAAAITAEHALSVSPELTADALLSRARSRIPRA